ncbi:COG2308 Uncharacterized conserved protein [Rhabdaerophilaceae bacterium]
MPGRQPIAMGEGLRLLESYRPQPGVSDELLDAQGKVRLVWRGFLDYLAGIPSPELPQRLARGDQYLRDAGVYYRQYDENGSAVRDWPLSHIPVLIEEVEWARICRGLVQRANLLEAIARDIYGENRLADGGHIPASLIAQNKEWLRPLVGIVPRGGNFLNFVAFEIGRGPDGEWWVLGDRTQAPSGAGFALENRVATGRVFSDFYAGANVHRLAGFFRQFRDTLNGLRGGDANRVAILTPGPLNETYFEHAYIARYLGFALLEGEDLTVENGQVMVRTVGGPLPIDVLWRRLDSNFADPLELNPQSWLGTPGLVSAVRQGNVTLVNALGSGVLEMRAMLAFMPRLAEHLLGAKLEIPNIATWWCGQPAEAAHVQAHATRMVIGDAHSTRLPFEFEEQTANVGQLSKTALSDLLARDGDHFVGQEVVTLSTSPALVNNVLQPRPMSLRVFLARNGEGWHVMPGGYARIGRSEDATAIAMRRGGSVADVWILSQKPVVAETMLSTGQGPFSRSVPGTLPSRAADNLYWLGRYIERTEGHLRLLRAYHLRFSESNLATSALLELLEARLEMRAIEAAQAIPEGLLSTIESAVLSASKIRDRFSVDGWMALNDLAKTSKRLALTVEAGDDCARAMGVLLRKVSGFTGLVHENMYRFVGWRFMSIGRALERAIFMTESLALMADADAPEGALDLAVEIGDSAMTHRRRYAVATTRGTVVDLLGLDSMNPRSILYSASQIQDHVGYLPGASMHGQMSLLARAILEIHTKIAVQTPETLTSELLDEIGARMRSLSDTVTTTYFQ